MAALRVRLFGQILHLRRDAEFVLAHPDSGLVKRAKKSREAPNANGLRAHWRSGADGLAFCLMRGTPATGQIPLARGD
ncbi:hypothetical protein A8H39_20000 [Paraburkholderia fungorum]|nr:hypothetical protein A8H39_20000 [Paraburkholderia fungorum]PZR49695.1 MAG: hypothetical protein DI523_07000 [Paraburkholderia fungorum]QLD50898.1 hypothetical protein C9419_08995 [Paraburkholderia fungorum]